MCVCKGNRYTIIHHGLCVIKNLNSVRALPDNGFASFSALLIDNLMKPDFLLERNEKLNKLIVLTLSIAHSFLDFFYLIHERRVCSDFCILLCVWCA